MAETEDIIGEIDEIREQELSVLDLNRGKLERYGACLDERPVWLGGRTIGMILAEKLLTMRTRAGGRAKLKANAVQRSFEERRGAHNIVLKARQMGITTWVAARFFLKTITRPGTLTLQVAHTQEAAEDLFQIVHRFVTWLPENLRKGPLKTGRANVRQIVFPKMDAQYRVTTAGDRNAGRGLTVQNLHCSELARWPGDPAETLAGLRAAMTPDAELIIESTPDGVGGCFHEEWLKAPETGMVRHFFPWWMEPLYRGPVVDEKTLTTEERELMERHGLSPEQIGYRRKIRSRFRKLAAQEYAEDAESCFRASGESYFEVEAIDARLAEIPKPTDLRRNGEMEIYLPRVEDHNYLVSVDPAGGGTEGDYSAVQVIDVEDGWQCAEFAGHVGGLELARLVSDLAREYNDAWVVVERNSYGSGVLAYLASTCQYDRIYEQEDGPGWLTTSKSRPEALQRMATALVETPRFFNSRKLLIECRSFVRQHNGIPSARAGMHDDRVMAMAIGLEVRAELLKRKGRRR